MFEFVTGISKGYPAMAANVSGEREGCFERGVALCADDAWVDAGEKDQRDDNVDVVGDEMPFNWYFCWRDATRRVDRIDVDLGVLSGGILEMLRGVHS